MLSGILLLTACGSGETSTDDSSDGADSTISGESTETSSGETGGEDDQRARTLVIAATQVPGGFDGDVLQPNTQNVVVQLNEPLVSHPVSSEQEDGAREVLGDTVEGRLAESWEVSEDGLEYVFTLRQGVLSPFGNELSSEDVVWSWEKSFDQERTGNFIANASNVSGVEAVSEYEVKFTLDAPSPIFLRALALYVPGIYDSVELQKHATEDDPWATEWLETNHAGFGPYMVESVTSGEQAVFVANPNYYRGEPHFERVIYREVPEASNRVQLLEAGDVDWIEEPTFRQLATLSGTDGVKVQSTTGNLQARVLMNMNFEPFDSQELRQAVNLAIDRETVGEVAFAGLGQAADGPLPPNFSCYTPDDRYDYDPEAARALLQEAGLEGAEVELIYSDIRGYNEDMVVQIQQSMQAAGFQVTLTKIPEADMWARSASDVRDLPFFTIFEQSIVLDPGYSLFLTSIPSGAADRSDYDNPTLTDLVNEANTTLDEETRCELIAEIQEIHRDDAPWGYTWLPGAHEAMVDSISGWTWYPDNHERWYDLSRG